jgi:hypothetical protein
MPTEIWARFPEVRVLRRVEADCGTGMPTNAASEGIGALFVQRSPHEESPYPYHIQ